VRLPTSNATAACYEQVRTKTPELWAAFQERLVPVAEGDGPPEERIREIGRLERELWERFRETDADSRARALGRSWPCCVEDLIAAVVREAIPAIAGGDEPVQQRRERLEGLRALVQEGRPPSLTGNTVGFDLQRAIGELR
jgi:hypothetical protein